MTNQELLDQIKKESRLSDDATFDELILGLLNEFMIEAVISERPHELKEAYAIPVVPLTGYVDLPSDFLIHHQVFFQDGVTQREYILHDEDMPGTPAPRGMYGHPKTFELFTQGLIELDPIDELELGDFVRLVYYKKPTPITEETLADDIQINRLLPFLVRATVRRLRMFHSDDMQVAQMLSGDVSSAANAFTQDEPETERNTRSN